MKNYLKKAISAVIALALAASIVPASFAANVVLTDVADTADYATAVKTLVALKVINGYEDNTFLPDNKITRAEASKVIVAALNETAAAEAMKGATKFSDIAAKHEWATGYINKGVSMGYINGMENNTFQPDGNVTYAQVIKMMLCAMGYEDYAASLAEQYNYTGANWYIPYTQLAADAGITDGVYAGPNEAVTRAQVAQLVYNAVKAPIVKNIGIDYTDSGKIVPKIQIQDGSDDVYFKSILTEKFDAYFVEGYVVKTQKDNTGLKADEVDFAIAKTQKYDQEDVCILNSNGKVNNVNTLAAADVAGRRLTKVKVGDTDAAEYKGTYATAIVVVDEYEDWALLNFVPSGRNKSTKIDLGDIDTAEYENAGSLDQAKWTAIQTSQAPYIKFFVDGAKTSTKYMLDAAANVKTYVNGVQVTSGDPIWTYVINGDIGDVELVDTYKTDGKVDTIYVSSYISGMVSNVSSSGKITLDDADENVTSITLDKEDSTKEFHIYFNGEEVAISDLKENDVLTVAYDVTAGNTKKIALANSKFYDVYVSRDVVTETLKGKDKDDAEAKFGDTYYPFASTTKFNTFDSASKLGDEYTAYLDAFGRIFKADINSSAANWGIAEKFTKSDADDDYKLTVYTADGATKYYYFDAAKAEVKIGSNAAVTKGSADASDWNSNSNTTEALGEAGLIDVVGDAVYSNFGSQNLSKNAIQGRVIQYKVASSSGKITELKFIANDANTTGSAGGVDEFRTRNSAIGLIKMGEATKVIDATKYADNTLLATTIAGLVDEVSYEAYAYGSKIDGAYPFVLITMGEAAYNAKSRFAVVTEKGYAEEEDEETGDAIYSIAALNGEATELLVSDDVSTSTLSALNVGDVFYFMTNAKGYVTDIDVVFSVGSSVPEQATLAANSLKNNNKTYTNLTGISIIDLVTDTDSDGKTDAVETGFSSKFVTDWSGVQNDAIQLIYGPIIENKGSYISIGAIDSNGKTNTANASEAVEFDVASEINVYTYDYAQTNKDYRFDYSTSISAVGKSNIAKANLESDGNTIDWNKQVDSVKVNQESVNFAFAVVVEGEIVDIFAFLAK